MKQLKRDETVIQSASLIPQKKYIDCSHVLFEKTRANSMDEAKFPKLERKETLHFPPIHQKSSLTQTEVRRVFSRVDAEKNKESLKSALSSGQLSEKSFIVSFSFV